MNPARVVLSIIAAGLVILVVSMITDALIQVGLPYNVLELGGMRSVNDPIMALFFLHYWVVGLALAVLYAFTRKSLQGTVLKKGIGLGVLGWLVYNVPSAFVVFTSMNYPIGFTVQSVAGSLLSMLAAGIAIAKIRG